MLSQSFVESSLECLVVFLDKYRHLAEAHLTDFIVDDLWSVHVPEDMRVGFLCAESEDTDDEWFGLVSNMQRHNGDNFMSTGTRLDDFVHAATSCRLDVLLEGQLLQLDGLINIENLSQLSSKEELVFDAYAGHKKQHEVEVLSFLVAAICQKHKISQVIDLGSGKGYLSSFLALQQGLNVLGIDVSKSNVANATERNQRLQKSWVGLVKRATTRGQGEKPKRRPGHSVEKETTSIRLEGPTRNPGSFVAISQFVDDAIDLGTILSRNCGQTSSGAELTPFVLTGLHTCGNLAARVLESYVKELDCQAVICVGCCYHLIDEEFCLNSYADKEPFVKSAFPMSSFLREKRFSLGRNTRMLGCEALQRILSQRSKPSTTLFHRALLKVILRDKYGDKYDKEHVGRLAKNKEILDFKDYVRRAMLKINAREEISDSEILSYLQKYVEYQKLMHRFCRLRSLLAPAIESIILLDRLCYLQVQEHLSSSYLVQLFDPVISPRCHAIVSSKK